MEFAPAQQDQFPSPPSVADRAWAFMEVLLVWLSGTLLLAPLIFWAGMTQDRILSDVRILFVFLISEAALTLAVLYLLLRIRGEGWDLLASRPADRNDIKAGLVFVPILVLTVIVSGLLFQWFLPEWVTLENPILNLLTNPLGLVLMILSSILVGGVKEELQRAFVLVRFERYLGGSLVGLVLWSVVFGLGHVTQGADNAVRAGLLGLILGLLFLRRRNPLGPVIGHATYNVLVVLFAWFALS